MPVISNSSPVFIQLTQFSSWITLIDKNIRPWLSLDFSFWLWALTATSALQLQRTSHSYFQGIQSDDISGLLDKKAHANVYTTNWQFPGVWHFGGSWVNFHKVEKSQARCKGHLPVKSNSCSYASKLWRKKLRSLYRNISIYFWQGNTISPYPHPQKWLCCLSWHWFGQSLASWSCIG